MNKSILKSVEITHISDMEQRVHLRGEHLDCGMVQLMDTKECASKLVVEKQSPTEIVFRVTTENQQKGQDVPDQSAAQYCYTNSQGKKVCWWYYCQNETVA
ncbi:MAG: hypothetical protein NVSMB9_15070 [Isosphaeraceae bacterium]